MDEEILRKLNEINASVRGGVAKIIETTELVRRVEALEAMRVTELQRQICFL